MRLTQRKALAASKITSVSRSGAGSIGTLSNWRPKRQTWRGEGSERDLLLERANDIALNDAHGAGLIDSIAVNTVGPGIWPQSRPNFKRLGITEEQAREIAEAAEWEFELWNNEADASALTPETATVDFYGIQFMNLWSMLVNGEFLNLPLMLDRPARRYSLALQTVDPVRLRTPAALWGDPSVRDGIRLGPGGETAGFFLADPPDGRLMPHLDLSAFRELSAARGHRPTVIHRFHKKTPEQVRGSSVLAPAMKFFRDLADYLDHELVGAIVASSFPVWIEKSFAYDANGLPFATQETGADGQDRYYQEVAPGGVFYGNRGEKPHILKNDRPGSSFGSFIETILRALGSATGMPYEVIAKDFSKTNYSSARAALEEAWRVFALYQDWLVNRYCQVVWGMFFEEAFLRGRIRLPKGAPDFYAARAEYLACNWIVPKRTTLDPVKEVVAAVMAKQNNMGTDADWYASRGEDWEAKYEQRKRERDKAAELKLPLEVASKPSAQKKPTDPDDPEASADAVAGIVAEAVREEVRRAIKTEERST